MLNSLKVNGYCIASVAGTAVNDTMALEADYEALRRNRTPVQPRDLLSPLSLRLAAIRQDAECAAIHPLENPQAQLLYVGIDAPVYFEAKLASLFEECYKSLPQSIILRATTPVNDLEGLASVDQI